MTHLTDWQRLVGGPGHGHLAVAAAVAGAGQCADEQRRIVRDAEALWRRLQEGGLQVIDHTGEVYDATKSLRVIAFEPAAQLSREQIVETIKPTIYYHQEWIQTGEVVVGMPGQPAPSPPPEEDRA